jgi:bla regulator protein blaR1
MALSFAHVLVSATVASSAAIIFVALLRKPFRVAAGAQAAYWLWLLVPVSVLAILFPAPSHTLLLGASPLPSSVGSVLHSATTGAAPISPSSGYVTAALMIWAAGAGVGLVLMINRQWRFVRSLGPISSDAMGIGRSNFIVTPILVGVWRPQIVVPVDFEARYSVDERALVLEHERAHWDRGDIVINALSAAWLCLSWFNPLTYWAFGMLRLDQEIACDALVLERLKTSARCYADALLKTQLATEAPWRMPVGCHWQSMHPLKERVAMLKRPLPGLLRRLVGFALALGLTFACGYAVWASTAQLQSDSLRVLIHLKLVATNSTGATTQATEFLANSGEPVKFLMGATTDARCVAFLPRIQGGSLVWDKHAADTKPAPAKGNVWLECLVSSNDKVVATPSVITLDSEPSTVDFYNPELATHYVFEIIATTSTEKIAAERQASGSNWLIPAPDAATPPKNSP